MSFRFELFRCLHHYVFLRRVLIFIFIWSMPQTVIVLSAHSMCENRMHCHSMEICSYANAEIAPKTTAVRTNRFSLINVALDFIQTMSFSLTCSNTKTWKYFDDFQFFSFFVPLHFVFSCEWMRRQLICKWTQPEWKEPQNISDFLSIYFPLTNWNG